jgi:hypothetical protein
MSDTTERKARKLLVESLPASWKAVTSGGASESILTAPDGRPGTICVQNMGSGVFRFQINRFTARRRGTNKMVSPELEPQSEVTVAQSEIPAYAAWCARWVADGTSVAQTPSPTPLDTITPAYIWTVAAKAHYDLGRRARK